MKGKKAIALLVISFILINAVLLSAFALPGSQALVYGDFDNDLDFDSDDYALFRQFMLGMISKDKVPATTDVDGNGQYDSDDYAYMRQHLLGMIKIFPVQSPIIPSPTSTSYATPNITPIATPTFTPVPTPTFTPVPTVEADGLYIDSSKVSSDMLKVTLYIKNIANFSGYQANLAYDPQVLKPVYSDRSEYDSQSPVETGSLLTKNYIPVDFALHDLQKGILNFGRTYLAVNSYKDSEVSESSGSIGVIYFRILKNQATQIGLENCQTMPGAINGTLVTDWDANQLLNYSVNGTITVTPDGATGTPTTSTPTPAPYDWYEYYGYW